MSGRVLRPDCAFGECSWCRIGEVVVEGIVIVKKRRCDCSCHTQSTRGMRGEDVPAMPRTDQR